MNATALACLVVSWFGSGLIAGYLYQHRVRSGCDGFLVGFLLGPLGILLARKLAHSETKRCPACAELNKPSAQVCRFCGKDLVLLDASSPPPE